MVSFLIALHVVVALALVAIILLQGGKGADLASVFGGGTSGTAFGVTGAAPFIAKVTTAVAVGFMLTCVILSYVYTPTGAQSVIQKAVQQGTQTGQQPAEQPAAAASAATVASEAQTGPSTP